MKQVLIRAGEVLLEEVPAPAPEPGRLLVAVRHSCISVGTELSGVRASGKPLLRRAIENPAQVRQVIERVRETGIGETRDLVRRKLQTLNPVGYSAAGEVIEIGAGIDRFRIGDAVACAGTGWASHAEIVSVPRNLAAPVPDGLDLRAAATVTLGAIAMQGVRRAAPTIGETFLVIGLGIIGQLTARILNASGIAVIGLDPRADRCALARDAGIGHAFSQPADAIVETAHRLSDGHGVDGVIVTAANPSDEVLATAFRACRKKGRVVLVGDVGLNIARADIYEKELDFLVSTSYGPGRYDRAHEERGLDYPLAYVRWTEGRNMAAYLGLIADRRMTVDDLVARAVPLAEAPAAYAALNAGTDAPIAMILDYDRPGPAGLVPARSVGFARPKAASDAIRLALIGAGGFMTATMLPLLARLASHYTLETVVTRQGVSAVNVAKQFGFARASIEIDDALSDPAIDAVMIGTRHDRHGALVLRALEAGKAVFVEKPLCLNEAELAAIEAFYADATEGEAPLLTTGFNRRFAPMIAALRAAIADRTGPLVMHCRVNAGFIAGDNWVHGPEGGGRNLGEACHFYDLFTALTGARIVDVSAAAIDPGTAHYRRNDNFGALLRFADGSLATLTYTALGDPAYPKERLEVFCDGQVHEIDDYRSYRTANGREAQRAKVADKGHREELVAFAAAFREAGGDWPIPLWQQVQATRIALAVEDKLARPQG